MRVKRLADRGIMSFAQYVRFLAVGGFVALVTVAVRELVGYLLGADTAANYSISILFAYVVGIISNFVLNARFTFRSRDASWSRFVLFLGVAFASLLSTWLLSLIFRYGVGLDAMIGKYGPTVAFASAALVSSVITYRLTALFVFPARESIEARRLNAEREVGA